MCYIELNLNQPYLLILVVLIHKTKAGFCNQALKLIFEKKYGHDVHVVLLVYNITSIISL